LLKHLLRGPAATAAAASAAPPAYDKRLYDQASSPSPARVALY
jgi:hypothetical protein